MAEATNPYDQHLGYRQDFMDVGPRFFLRTRLMRNMLKGETGTLLDVGCGDGFFLEGLPKLGFVCTGIDTSARAIERCRERVGPLGVELFCLPIGEFHPAVRFDLAVCGEVLEHIEDDVEFLGQISRLLRESGKLVLSVPLDMRLWNEADVRAGHFRRYTKDEIAEKLKATGYEVERYVIWGYPLIRFLHFWLRRQQDKRMGEERKLSRERDPLLKFKGLLRWARYLFLFDNLFNFSERGVGIIVKARKVRDV